ncbi:MAG: radical SAM protein [Bacillota bacterium]|nr:radical SAM protein [Bacillota bacterium]
MKDFKFLYGPVPSRRLGISLGISPIPKKTCNYSCIYCQLGRTDKLVNERSEFYKVQEIINELKVYLKSGFEFDVITIVGEGEPTLYLKIGELIMKIKELTDKPVVVITNGSLLSNQIVQNELEFADIVLPSFDAYDEKSFKTINRPYAKLKFDEIYDGLIDFSKKFKGQLWIEIMLLDEYNSNNESLLKFKSLLSKIKYDRLYLNTSIRPPAEEYVKAIDSNIMDNAINILGGISIENLISVGFKSDIKDDYQAIMSIIKRHPMNQFEIKTFLNSRKCSDIDLIINRLNKDKSINKIDYKGYVTYRFK